MVYASVEVEYEIDDAWNELNRAGRKEFIGDVLRDDPDLAPTIEQIFSLEPAHLLDTITSLRALGYTVEPA